MRYVIIINGSRDKRHLENVEQAVGEVFKGYEIFVASPQNPGVPDDHYFGTRMANVLESITRLGEKITAGDELVIYTTGHGTCEKKPSALKLQDGSFYEEVVGPLDKLPYLRRTVVMEQCLAGNMADRFLDDKKTLFLAATHSEEDSYGGMFGKRLWSAEDVNGDGYISWQERFQNVVQSGPLQFFPQFRMTSGYIDDGTPPFSASVERVDDEAGLERQIARLSPGQYAFVLFSASWCKPCHLYMPKFEEAARTSRGQHLFIFTENEDLARKYGFDRFPSVMLLNDKGTILIPENRYKLLDEPARFDVPVAERLVQLRERFGSLDSEVGIRALRAYFRILGRADRPVVESELASQLEALPSFHPMLQQAWLSFVFKDVSRVPDSMIPKTMELLCGVMSAASSDSILRYKASYIYLTLLRRVPKQELLPELSRHAGMMKSDNLLVRMRGYDFFSMAAKRLSDDERARWLEGHPEVGAQLSAVELRRKDGSAFYAEGKAKFDRGDYQGALEDFNKAIATDPTNGEALLYRGLSKIELGNDKGALADLSALLKLNPVFSPALYHRGRVRAKKGDLQGAIEDLGGAKPSPEVYLEMANIYERMEKYNGVERAASGILQFRPDDVVALRLRSMSRIKMRNFSGALQDTERELKLNPDSPEALWDRGTVRLNLDDRSGAREDFSRAVELDPKYAPLIETQLGKPRRAELTFSPHFDPGEGLMGNGIMFDMPLTSVDLTQRAAITARVGLDLLMTSNSLDFPSPLMEIELDWATNGRHQLNVQVASGTSLFTGSYIRYGIMYNMMFSYLSSIGIGLMASHPVFDPTNVTISPTMAARYYY